MQRNWSGHDVCCRYVEASVKGIIVEEAMQTNPLCNLNQFSVQPIYNTPLGWEAMSMATSLACGHEAKTGSLNLMNTSRYFACKPPHLILSHPKSKKKFVGSRRNRLLRPRNVTQLSQICREQKLLDSGRGLHQLGVISFRCLASLWSNSHVQESHWMGWNFSFIPWEGRRRGNAFETACANSLGF